MKEIKRSYPKVLFLYSDRKKMVKIICLFIFAKFWDTNGTNRECWFLLSPLLVWYLIFIVRSGHILSRAETIQSEAS